MIARWVKQQWAKLILSWPCDYRIKVAQSSYGIRQSGCHNRCSFNIFLELVLRSFLNCYYCSNPVSFLIKLLRKNSALSVSKNRNNDDQKVHLEIWDYAFGAIYNSAKCFEYANKLQRQREESVGIDLNWKSQKSMEIKQPRMTFTLEGTGLLKEVLL